MENKLQKQTFSIDEISKLEAIEIKGGKAAAQSSQTGCSNNIAGCSCQIVVVPNK